MADTDAPPARAFISVGSNMAPQRNLPRALDLLRRRATVLAVSTVYRTRPIGPPGQQPFVNTVWCIAPPAPPRALKFELLRTIEAELGRVRTDDRYAPRPIDLDILLYGDIELNEPDLTLPAPDIARPFVIAGLIEIDPALHLPGDAEPVSSRYDVDLSALTRLEELTTTLRESLHP